MFWVEVPSKETLPVSAFKNPKLVKVPAMRNQFSFTLTEAPLSILRFLVRALVPALITGKLLEFKFSGINTSVSKVGKELQLQLRVLFQLVSVVPVQVFTLVIDRLTLREIEILQVD